MMYQAMNSKKILLFFLGLAVMLFLVALPWIDLNKPRVVNLAQREFMGMSRPNDAITYAVLPQYSRLVTYEKNADFVEYLHKITGLRVVQVFPASFQEHLKMLKRGEIDISYMNPVSYIHAAKDGARAFARPAPEDTEHRLTTDIVTRKDNNKINRIDDCVGKRWIALDRLSCTGYTLPMAYFLDNGIKKNNFSALSFTSGSSGLQEKALLSVQSGKYDFTTIPGGSLHTTRGSINVDNFKVISTSDTCSSWVFAASKHLSPAILKKISDSMLLLNPEIPSDKVVLDNMNMKKIIPTSDSEFDSVREIVRRVHPDNDTEAL